LIAELATPQPTPRTLPAVSVRGVSKTYGATQALRDVELTVERGTVHALLGGNGSGKSTLIKILAGVVPADPGGTIVLNGARIDVGEMTPASARGAGLHFVHQHPTVFADLSVGENLAMGHDFAGGGIGRVRWRDLHKRADIVLQRFEVPASSRQLLRDLRPATRTMVAIARALQDQEDSHDGVLLLDEPTAALPKAEVQRLLAAIRRFASAGQTVVLVTHRIDEMLDVADHATVLRDGVVVDTVAVAGLDERAVIEMTLGSSLERLYPDRRKIETNEVALECVHLRVGPLRDVNLEIRRSEILGVAGLLGSGRTELLQAIFGALPNAGAVVGQDRKPLRAGVGAAMARGIAYLPEDRDSDAAFPETPVSDNITVASLQQYWRRLRINRRREQADGAAAVSRFLIKSPSPFAPLSALSGGNQQKTMLARWLQRSPRVLLLDEPTQGVDVGARAEIYRLIRDAADTGCAVLIVSSDFEELTNVCDRVVVLAEGQITADVAATDLTSQSLTELVYRADAS
jgi:ribose transport system ATP-binding protein